VIVDVEATTSVREAEVTAQRRMIERAQERFSLLPERLAANGSYGDARNLLWLVDDRAIEVLHRSTVAAQPHARPSPWPSKHCACFAYAAKLVTYGLHSARFLIVPVFDAPLELLTLLGHSGVSAGIKAAMTRSAGARVYRCALQVNPFDYCIRHAKDQVFDNEEQYNASMVAAAIRAGVEVVAVTDHFRVSSSSAIIAAFEEAGIAVFPGFEANSSEGIHLLCLFAPGTPLNDLERHIGACSLADANATSPQSTKSCEQLLETVAELGGLSIAAHVSSAAGLLSTLSGQSRARAWKSEHLAAAALPGAPDEAPQNHRDIIRNKDQAAKRHRPLCIINAGDVCAPEDFADPRSTTLIKMTTISLEGLRQGFLDWESRIRLNSDNEDGEHTEIVAVAWQGGLLDGQSLRLNSGLNVLVGGRGAGKSTMIESLRYAFDLLPKGQEAIRSHQSIIKSVLGTASTVSVLLRSPRPSPQHYLIERIYGQRPTVRDQSGKLLPDVAPGDLVGSVEIFGQHEISELTRHPDKLAEILRRFTGPATDTSAQRVEFREKLERSRSAILSELAEIDRIDDALAALPGLQENLKRFATAGLETKLAEKTSIDTEGRVFDAARKVVDELDDIYTQLEPEENRPSLLPASDGGLPNRSLLEPLDKIVADLDRARARAAQYLSAVSERLKGRIDEVEAAWQPLKTAADTRYLATVKELEADGHDPKKFVAIKGQVEALKPKEAEQSRRMDALGHIEEERRTLLLGWEQFKAQDFRDLERAARRVSKRLANRVRVRVQQNSDLGGLEAVFRTRIAGNINQPLERLRARDSLGLSDLAQHVRQGAQTLVKEYGFSQSGAEKVAQGGRALALEIEECELPAEAIVELNVGSRAVPNWKALEDLSTGQKATAVLLLLLLELDAPLIVDQPEDDLDNRFIADSIVPAMRDEKRRRQFIFSSHNANIPVLGDAEQIVGLTPIVDGGLERTVLSDDLCGSIDVAAIKELVKDVLEGGQKAFTTRREKYGF
jgi:PHP family Zn ribbon phosphoesterase